MKITKSYLKQIIKEEITRMDEALNLDKLTDQFANLVRDIDINDARNLKLDPVMHAQVINGSIPFKLEKRMKKSPEDKAIVKAYRIAGAILRR